MAARGLRENGDMEISKTGQYLLSVRFAGMEPGDFVYLTDAGQPFEVMGEFLEQYAGNLWAGEGFLGDLGDVYGEEWDPVAVLATPLGEGFEVPRNRGAEDAG